MQSSFGWKLNLFHNYCFSVINVLFMYMYLCIAMVHSSHSIPIVFVITYQLENVSQPQAIARLKCK